MAKRNAVLFPLVSSVVALSVSLGAVGCGSAEDAPPVQNQALTSPTPSSSFSAAPPASTAPPAPLPPLGDYDAGPVVPLEAGPVVPAGDGGTPVCPNGGEAEVEPNDVGTPNVLNTERCGVLTGGDVDYLQINLQAWDVEYGGGAINVELINPASAGGAYLLKITAKNPATPTNWWLRFK